MTIPQSELQGLFPKFAAPLVSGEAAKRFGEPVAKQLAQTFWQMMIDGPKSEAYLWKSFGGSFTFDDVAMLRRCFYEEMKPSISPEQLTALGEWCLGDRVDADCPKRASFLRDKRKAIRSYSLHQANLPTTPVSRSGARRSTSAICRTSS